jgi:glycerol-3-phosphate dehydrogenase subunit C
MSEQGLGGIKEYVFDPASESFWDGADLASEERRVFEVCNGCRLCAALCPSFDILFAFIDERDITAEGLGEEYLHAVMDACYYCKLCYTKCPYTPPHEFRLDFPHLALRHKALHFKKHGAPLAKRILADPAGIARRSRPIAPLANAANRFKPMRHVLSWTLGIHPDAPLPPVASRSFEATFKKLPRPQGATETAVLFSTCLVDGNYPGLGEALVAFLGACGVEVILPGGQECCGIPSFDIGDIGTSAERARRNIALLAPYAKRGLPILAPVSSCAMMIATEYPLLVPGEDAKAVAAASRDLFGYLWELKGRGLWPKAEPQPLGDVAYHLPCHLKQMGAGFRGRDLLAALSGTKVKLLDACSGHDGTYGIRTETFEASMKIGKKLFNRAKEAEGLIATECPLSALQIEHATGKRPEHPVVLLARAYGIGP